MRQPKLSAELLLWDTGITVNWQLTNPVPEATHGSFSIPIDKPAVGEGLVTVGDGAVGVRLPPLHAATPNSNDKIKAKGLDADG